MDLSRAHRALEEICELELSAERGGDAGREYHMRLKKARKCLLKATGFNFYGTRAQVLDELGELRRQRDTMRRHIFGKSWGSGA